MRKAIRALNMCLKRANQKQVLLMFSGGSALELLDGIELSLIGKHITVTVLDERYSRDPAINNFAQVAQTDFYREAEKKGIDYIDTRVHYRITLHRLAGKFDRALKRWRKNHPEGCIIVTQGIGEDGHTAGILPYSNQQRKFQRLFEHKQKWIVAYSVPKAANKYTRRMTVTFPFLREQADCSIVYATGKDKRRAIRKTLAKSGSLEATPSRVIQQMAAARLYTDL